MHFALGFMGVSLGNHYPFCARKVWLPVVNVWIKCGFGTVFEQTAGLGNQVTSMLPCARFGDVRGDLLSRTLPGTIVAVRSQTTAGHWEEAAPSRRRCRA
jgi:hypothetical protein